MIDDSGREVFWKLANAARSGGKDLAEVLDRAGVLLTDQRRKDIQADVLGDLAEMLETTNANQWTISEYRHPNNEDIRIGIATRLRQLEQATRKVGWRKG